MTNSENLTCKDCYKFGRDFNCINAREDDPVGDCWGFICKDTFDSNDDKK